MPIGTLVLPPPDKVAAGYGYGADGTEFVGTFIPTITSAPAVLALSENAERVREAVRAKLDDALPDKWQVYARRDFGPFPTDEWPRCAVVLLPERILEVETDGRLLVGYPCAVTLEVREAAAMRSDPPLSAMRRIAQQVLYTTDYAELVEAMGGAAVEEILIEENAGVPLPDVEDGVTATAFVVVVGLMEDRTAEAAG